MELTFDMFCRAACLVAVATLTACKGDPGDTDGATESTAGESTTTAGTTDGTPTTGTSTEGTMGGTATSAPTTGMPGTTTTDGPTTTDDATSAGTTEGTTAGTTEGTTEGTTGIMPDGLEGSCVAACDKFFECINQPPFPSEAECALECVGAAGDMPTCAEAYTNFNNCIAMLDCAQFMKAFMENDFGPCNDEFEAVEPACPTCEGFGGGGGPDSCVIGQQCPNEPEQAFECEGDTCTCLVGGQPTNTCPANGVCELGFEAQAEAANLCCGFEF